MSEKLLLKNLTAVYTPTYQANFNAKTTDILIEGNAISHIDHDIESVDARKIDCSGCVAIPGLVNTHHHFYQTLTRAIPRMQNSKLFPWLVEHYRVWSGIHRESVYWGSMTAMAELMLTGCTCTTDHHYLFPGNTDSKLIDVQFSAAAQLGMRFVATRGSMSVSQSKGGLPPDSVVQSERDIIDDSRRIIETYHDPAPDAMNRVALAPCSPFSVSEELMVETAKLARKHGVRLHTHLAETIDEEKYCIRTFGCRPVELMHKLNWLGEDVWFAHCVHLNPEEIKLFAETGTGVAHCPSSNMRLGSGIAPVKEYLENGVPVGIAVDGSASNDASDMLGELRMALMLQRVTKGADALKASDVIDMGSRQGATILGYDNIGMLEAGKPADIAVFRVDGIDFAGVQDHINGLIFAGNSHRADTVVINGKLTVSKGELVNHDAREIRNHAQDLSNELITLATEKTGINYRKTE